MNLSSTLCSTFLLISFVGHAKVTPDVTVNQVLSTLLEWKKPNIVKSANRRFARKEFHRGTFFKGEIAPAKKVANKLAKANPQVLETPLVDLPVVYWGVLSGRTKLLKKGRKVLKS